MRRKSLELVAARRDGERKCRGASYSGTQSLAPLAGQNSVKIAPKGYNPNFLLITGNWFGFTFFFSKLE